MDEENDDVASLLGTPSNLIFRQNDAVGTAVDNAMSTADSDFYLTGQYLTLTEDPTEERWCMQPIYKDDRVWQIGFDPDEQCMRIVHGKIDGAKQFANPPITAVGGKSVLEQALQDIRQRFKIKWRKDGYRYRGMSGPQRIGVQLAKKYAAPTKEKKGTDLVFPVAVQPKLDGIRSTAYLSETGSSVEFWSRSNKQQTKFAHIEAELLRFFQYLPVGAGLDGEMFAPVKHFQDLTSIIGRQSSIHPDMHIIGYHIFDLIIQDTEYHKRYSILVNAYRQYVLDITAEASSQGIDPVYNKTFHILSSSVANSHDQIMEFHQYFTSHGHEGTIIRKMYARCNHKKCMSNPALMHDRCTSYYQGRNKRNDNLLKLKDMDDEEGTIIDIEEEIYARDGDSVSLVVFVVQADNGTIFNCRPKATVAQRAHWFNNPEECIGKRYTYQYFGKSRDGVPRHPVGIAIRDYE